MSSTGSKVAIVLGVAGAAGLAYYYYTTTTTTTVTPIVTTTTTPIVTTTTTTTAPLDADGLPWVAKAGGEIPPDPGTYQNSIAGPPPEEPIIGQGVAVPSNYIGTTVSGKVNQYSDAVSVGIQKVYDPTASYTGPTGGNVYSASNSKAMDAIATAAYLGGFPTSGDCALARPLADRAQQMLVTGGITRKNISQGYQPFIGNVPIQDVPDLYNRMCGAGVQSVNGVRQGSAFYGESGTYYPFKANN